LRGQERLWGNLNGIDNAAWNPETDTLLPANFSFEDQAGKAVCKSELQKHYGLPQKADVPVVGVVARLSNQKGIDDIASSVRAQLQSGKQMQLVICGEGQEEPAAELRQLQAEFPDNIAFDPVFAADKEHTILAGSDFFLMPSRFEPCGLPQMYALRYLTVPIVRAVGGLEESISSFDQKTGEGTGFKFIDDLQGALHNALSWYGEGEEARQPLLKNCADADFSWDSASAPEQLAFFRRILNQKAYQDLYL
jgi:starch synthase